MNIGEAARASGISEKMIRHYESIGLITAKREANGYRTYADADIAVLRFIRHARDLAFPLEEVRRLLALWRDSGRASAEVRAIALDHVRALETKARALDAIAASLRHLAAHCHGDERPDCPIIDKLEGRTDEHHCPEGLGHDLPALRERHLEGDPRPGPAGGGAGRPRRRHRAGRDEPAA